MPPMDSRHTSTYSSPISSISILPVLLSTSVALLAVETTVRIFRRRSSDPPPMTTAPSDLPATSLAEFATKTRRILSDVQTLERQLALEKAPTPESEKQPQRRRRSKKRSQSYSHPQTQLITTTKHTRSGSLTCIITSHPGQRLSTEFSSFCERLLLMNRIWKQERQLKKLRADAETKKKEKSAAAFKSFCDQLVQWNRIWRLEKEVKVLMEEGERLKRGRVAAVTRAAKRMVLDVQKERLVEEFVKDLIEETAASKREAEEMKAEHEREVKEIHGEWLKDYRRVTRELERLKLAQEAKLVEQDVANNVEDSLHETLQQQKKRIVALETEVVGYKKAAKEISLLSPVVEEPSEPSLMRGFPDDESTDVEPDILSELSTSSTCVSSLGGSGRKPSETARRPLMVPKIPLTLTRKRCVSHGSEQPKRSLLFSTNDNPSTAVRTRSISALSRYSNPTTRSTGSEVKAGGSTIKPRAPWR